MNGNEPLTNPRHERFAQEIVKGKSATQAWIEAGYATSSAGQSANRALKNDEITNRIRYLEQQAAERTLISAEWVLNRLRIEAEGLGPDTTSSARTKATELLGKALSMFTDRVEHTGGVAITFIDTEDE